MATVVNKNLILKKAKLIRTTPSVNVVKTYRFERKDQYKKFVKWISSADDALKRKKDKLPDKKKIKGLSVNTSSALQGIALILSGLLIDSKNPEQTLKRIDTGAKLALASGLIATPFIGKHLLKKLFKPKVTTSATKLIPQIIKGPARKGIIKKASGEVVERTVKKKVSQKLGQKLTQKVATKVGPKAARFIPGFGSVIALGFAAHEFSQGDVLGGTLALASAIPVVGWAAIGVDIARDLGAFEGTPLGLNESEKKEQAKDLQEGIQSDIQTQQTTDTEELNNTFVSAVDKFGVSVSDFKKMSVGMSFGTGKSILTIEGIRDLIGSKKDDGYLGPKEWGIKHNPDDGFLGPKEWGIVNPFNLDTAAKTIQQDLDLSENNNRVFVKGDGYIGHKSWGIKTPKWLENMSNGNQLTGSGNSSVIVIPDETIVQSNTGGGMIPVPIASGGGGGVVVAVPSESEILNSLWTNILLTKLAQ